MRSLKLLLFISLVTLLFSCSTNGSKDVTTIPADQVATEDTSDPFRGLGIRYDGYYKEDAQGVHYLIRFFPNGNAVLINGTSDVGGELPGHLKADAIGDPVLGWYNVPVTVNEDSIFFKTYPEKGEISYKGNVPSTSMVRLLRHSHINGSRAIKEYIFQPDTTSGK